MNAYETLLQEAEDQGTTIKEKNLNIFSGLYMDGDIYVKKDLLEAEKVCIAAEELGHHHTCACNTINQKNLTNRKLELSGRNWVIRRLVRLTALVEGLTKGCRNRYDLAEYLGVTEEFLDEAVKYYKRKHGMFIKVGEVYLVLNRV